MLDKLWQQALDELRQQAGHILQVVVVDVVPEELEGLLVPSQEHLANSLGGQMHEEDLEERSCEWLLAQVDQVPRPRVVDGSVQQGLEVIRVPETRCEMVERLLGR